MLPTRFTYDCGKTANAQWGFNCGPGALCGLLNKTPAEIHPLLSPEFEAKGYTNPTLMAENLRRLGYGYTQVYRGDTAVAVEDLEDLPWPKFGLCRVQWVGRWCDPGVPMRARYRQSHWIAVESDNQKIAIFDINTMACQAPGNYQGWTTLESWDKQVMPFITEDDPKITGWWPTHLWEVTPLPNDS